MFEPSPSLKLRPRRTHTRTHTRCEPNRTWNVFCGKFRYGAPAVRGSFTLFHASLQLCMCEPTSVICCLSGLFIVRMCTLDIVFLSIRGVLLSLAPPIIFSIFLNHFTLIGTSICLPFLHLSAAEALTIRSEFHENLKFLKFNNFLLLVNLRLNMLIIRFFEQFMWIWVYSMNKFKTWIHTLNKAAASKWNFRRRRDKHPSYSSIPPRSCSSTETEREKQNEKTQRGKQNNSHMCFVFYLFHTIQMNLFMKIWWKIRFLFILFRFFWNGISRENIVNATGGSDSAGASGKICFSSGAFFHFLSLSLRLVPPLWWKAELYPCVVSCVVHVRHTIWIKFYDPP